jgi:hypothetical protein
MTTAIVWLTSVIVLTIVIIYFMKYKHSSPSKEGFLTKICPEGKTSYITHDGNTNCCSGEVINNHCENIFCSLSPGANNCQTVLVNQAQQRSAVKCPSNVAGDCINYFTNAKRTVQGCSKSPLNSDLTGPSDLSEPYCRLYDTSADNTSKRDSCQNYLVRYNAVSGLATCNAELARVRASIPVNPTSYVIYGGGLSGELPVTKILTEQRPPGPVKIYLSQDGPLVRGVTVDSGYTDNMSSLLFTGDLSQITNDPIYSILNKYSGSYLQAPNKYNIKKSDGTGILIAK